MARWEFGKLSKSEQNYVFITWYRRRLFQNSVRNEMNVTYYTYHDSKGLRLRNVVEVTACKGGKYWLTGGPR